MRTTVSKEIEFDAGHRVPTHGSKCKNPHGHRYRVRVTCTGDVVADTGASDDGMVVDFGDLKQWMTTRVHDRYDHGFIVYDDDGEMRDALAFLDSAFVVLVPWVPTAENMARAIFDDLNPIIDQHWRGNLALALVEVWETPTSLATYGSDR